MIKIEHTQVFGWEAAIRGMRNPLNSWDKSDSEFCILGSSDYEGSIAVDYDCEWTTYIGPNDQDLMKRLRKAGTDHRKFMRMIVVYADITAPLYWWKEFSTYKVGTVANSCSTMHTIHKKEFTLEDFSHEHLQSDSLAVLENVIHTLNLHRKWFIDKVLDDPKIDWWQMIQLLPSSYNQKRTVMLNYEVLANIYKSRKNHKLDEWQEFCYWIRNDLPFSSNDLPFSELITGEEPNLEYADQQQVKLDVYIN